MAILCQIGGAEMQSQGTDSVGGGGGVDDVCLSARKVLHRSL